ncbi:lytic transglycosylase domain-containing protein [Phenylobacterium sp.]|uniref:lytic transglycosylase domain-containing protein n=1 Tax=Phenylobacterium sp. TaxID=1871053 RepID=UPI00356ADB65
MILAPEIVLDLAAHCAPQAAPETLLAVTRVESGLDPLAIGVNGPAPRRVRVASRAEAIASARTLISSGANIDLGLAQINSANLGRLGLTVADAFDPCSSLAAGASLLRDNYQAVRALAADDQSALRTALSLYNTGDRQRGFRNGYVTRVVRSAAAAAALPAETLAPLTAPHPPAWDAFGDLRPAAFVTSPSIRQGDQP